MSTLCARLITVLGLSLAALHGQAADAELDRQALDALPRMGSYLRALPHFRISAQSHTDQQLENGQTLEFQHHTELRAVQPDKLQVTVESQGQTRSLYFNGQTFTLYSSANGYFAHGPAPASIDRLLDRLNERYSIQLPLADLFRWNTSTASDIGIISAVLIGDETLDGERCTHYAYRQSDIDWQLWVRNGEQPLPCRLVISRRDDPERPRHSVDLHWDLKRPIPAKAFEFTPPAGARRVPLREIDTGGQRP